ncbi:GTP cyclohydrolase I [Methylobacterium nodulans]|uniref:GTP cyclohydrolase I n=1 Tax=Methylobacterium nodulans (strain LMG 21967 / CNCM I-2342 / ORS 2060) TaxID=460265 RepID=B8IAM3_METNO|nr:GTP cyclohydrolase I [Methylobacterium nodulans]ACL61068.1 GTP cyclohydrolase I [Methylobacterium nodulans ORS 2060]
MISERIRARLRAEGVPFGANDTIWPHLTELERQLLEDEVADRAAALLDALIIDRENDHNTADTPRRLAKMFMREVFRGRYVEAPCVTDFPNVRKVDQVYVVGPVSVRSTCSHHFAPILGSAWVGVIPGERVIGLSKFNRLADWIFSRPQIQEEAVVQLADAMEEAMQPRGLGVIVRARHLCCAWRGVRDQTEMVSSEMRGLFRTEAAARGELLALVGQGVTCR